MVLGEWKCVGLTVWDAVIGYHIVLHQNSSLSCEITIWMVMMKGADDNGMDPCSKLSWRPRQGSKLMKDVIHSFIDAAPAVNPLIILPQPAYIHPSVR